MSEPPIVTLSPDKPTEATTGDKLLGRVVLLLGLVAVLDLVGIVLLSYAERSVPDALVATLGGAVTGLAGLLAARRT